VSEEKLNRLETLLVSLTDTVNQRFETTERRFNNIDTRIKTLELDMEPDGRISEAFDRIVEDIDGLAEESRTKFNQINKRLDRLEHGQNQIKASLATILERLTGWSAEE
jgi:chromosome segregation ATPase